MTVDVSADKRACKRLGVETARERLRTRSNEYDEVGSVRNAMIGREP